MSHEEIINKYSDQIDGIMRYGKHIGFDFENMTPDTLGELIKAWLHNGTVFYQKINEAPLSVKKRIFKIDTE